MAPRPLGPGEQVELSITDLDDVGAGIGAIASDDLRLRVHVAGALPGERIAASLAHVSVHSADASREAWAELRAVVEASPDRVAPACAAYGRCGGCALMALAYPAQLAYKRRRVASHLHGRTQLADAVVEACVPAPALLGYRNQAKYVYGYAAGAGQPVLGAFAPRSHRIADLAGCRVVVPCIDQVREALLGLLRGSAVAPFDERRRTGLLRYVVMHATDAGQVLVTLVAARSDWPRARELATALVTACPVVAGVVLNVNATPGNRILGDDERLLSGTDTVDDAVGKAAVRLSSRSFFQANREVAASIQKAVLAAVPAPVARAVDVYAGAAPFALALAAVADEVVAIEENPAATATAAAAIAERGGRSHRVRLVTGDAALALAAIASAEVLVVDPPRKGCAPEVLAAIVRLRPRLLAYVSCDPASLARDLAVLVASGARLVRITPFDMMPHTPHVETLALVTFG